MSTTCLICPRQCGVDRSQSTGFCQSGPQAKVARAALHLWEEPCISGERGSGTVFFSHCSLRCVYCQNHEISQGSVGQEISIDQLYRIFLNLQEKGAHNINLVTPSHYAIPISEALRLAKAQGLRIPIVYNSHGYESLDTLERLNGLIDIYLPDFKYWDRTLAERLSHAADYPEVAARAILKMLKQVGSPVFGEDGLMTRGLLVRHLVLPNHLDNTFGVLDWIADFLPPEVYVSIMAQYTPCHHASEYADIARPLNPEEYDRVIDYFWALGLENGFVQELDSADEQFVPPFDLTGLKD